MFRTMFRIAGARLAVRRRALIACRRGSVLSLTALSLPIIFIVSALAVDLGLAFVARGKADTAALFAAESAMARLPDAPLAIATAEQAAGLMLRDVTMTTPVVTATSNGLSVTVRVEIDARPVFGGLMGYRGMRTAASVTRPVSAGAVAKAGAGTEATDTLSAPAAN